MSTVRSVTAYQYVADSLRRQIMDSKLTPGAQLPPERELCDRFSASRITIRRALQILAEETLIERRQGLGTFVSPTPSRRIPLLNSDFSGSMAAHAPDLSRTLDTRKWRKADGWVAASLHTFPGAPVLFARRLDLLHDVPVAFDEIHLPETMADQLTDDDLAKIRFLERWEAVQQIQISHLSQRIEAVPASRQQAKILGVKGGAPLLKEVDVIYLATSTPCGVFVSYYRHDLFQLTSTVRLTVSRGDEEDL